MAIFRVPVQIVYPQQGGPGYNVFHVRTIGPAGDDADQLSEALDALEEFYLKVRGTMTPGTSIRIGEGMIKDPLGSPEYQQDDLRVVPVVGSGGTPGPSLLAVVVSWRTPSASRSGRGRSFIGPFQTTAIGDTPDTATIQNLTGAASKLVSSSTGPSGWSVGVLSVKQQLLRDITGYKVRDRWSFLSSRRD